MLKYQTLRQNIFTTSDYNKFTYEILDTKSKSENLATRSDVNAISKRASKTKETFYLSFFS